MEMIQAKNLARAQCMPVAVENRWLRFDMAFPHGDVISEDELDHFVGPMALMRFTKCLVVWIDGRQEAHQACTKCKELHPATEFTHTFYCPQSQGMESEDFDECLECRREANEAQAKAAGL